MANRGKKMNLGEFLGDKAAAYIPEAALPTGPRARDEFEDDRRGGFGDRRGGDRGDRFGDREPSRSDQSDQWRGDRGGFGGGDRGGDRFGGPSRYDRPARDEFRSEERPASMRLNLTRRSDAPGSPRGGGGFQGRGDVRAGGDDKFAGAFRSGGGSRFGDRGGDARFGDRGGDRFGDRGGDRFGGDRGGDRFGGDRFGDRRGGDRYGDDRGSNDRFSSRFGNDRRDDDRGLSSAFGSMRVNEQQQQQPQRAASPANEELDKKARAQKLREERKKKAEEERLAAEEAKKAAAEAKKKAEEEAAQKAEGDRAIMAEVLASGKTGDELAKFAKDVFAKSGHPSGGVVVEAVTKQAEAVAKGSANWIAPTQYGGLLKLALASAEVAEQVKALYALQVFLNAHDFPKGVLEKCFMALYTLDIIEEKAFFDYKYDVDNDAPGRMKAIVQTSNWLTWLETPEEGSDEEDDE